MGLDCSQLVYSICSTKVCHMGEDNNKSKINWIEERESVANTARAIHRAGLVSGKSGNVSLRITDNGKTNLMAITPSRQSLSCLTAEQIPVVDFDMNPVEGQCIPSSESLMHVAIYKSRIDVGAVIHTHSLFSTVASITGHKIPAIVDEMVVTIGGPIYVADYGFPGSQDLADNICTSLGNRNAALLRNHGAVGVGTDLEQALEISIFTERLTKIFVYSKMLGKINEIPKESVAAEEAIFEMMNQREIYSEG